MFDIDYGMHNGNKSLHMHIYINGVKEQAQTKLLTADSDLYKKYNSAFKGVEL